MRVFEFEAVIFDMDDTIALTQPLHKLAFNMTMRAFDISLAMIPWWDADYIGKGNVYIIKNVIKRFNLERKLNGYTAESLVELWCSYYQLIIKEKRVELVPGFCEFNMLMDSFRLKKIIATGGLKINSQIIIEKMGINIPDIVSLEDIVNPKPDPEIFLKAAEIVSVHPSKCIVFEDSVFGIRGAKKAGMKVVALTTTHNEEILMRENPDFIVGNYREFKLLIE